MKTVKEQYQQQVRRIRRRIKAMRGRGYDVPENIIPRKPLVITAGSVRRLQKITSQKIAAKSMYYGKASQALAVSGAEGYKLEREASKRKAKATREKRKRERELQVLIDVDRQQRMERIAEKKRRKEEQKQFEAERRRKDAEERKRLESDPMYQDKFGQATLSWERLEQSMMSTGVLNPSAEIAMHDILESAISQYGDDAVLRSVHENASLLAGIATDLEKYDPKTKPYIRAINSFAKLVGVTPSASDIKRWTTAVESDESADELK